MIVVRFFEFSIFLRIRSDEIRIHCIRCFGTAIHASMGLVLRELIQKLEDCDTCELSARGPLAAYLMHYSRSVALSEYFSNVVPGTKLNGIRCEDVQNLSYANGSFDIITDTEVLEHVPNDRRALIELRRALKPIWYYVIYSTLLWWD